MWFNATYRVAPTVLALALLFPASNSVAQEAGVIEGLQIPAWIERAGTRVPLKAGALLENGDTIHTGKGGRILLRLAEGSQVKLGENAEFRLRELKRPEKPSGAFRGFLEVIKGAFRYTTSLLSQRHRRHLDIRIATVTAGIRGTDIWGKATDEKDIVCLIEGEITVTRGDDPPLTLSDPLTFYIAPRGKPPLPVGPVDAAQLARWAAQTELEHGAGVLLPDGRWRVNLASFRTRQWATVSLREFHVAGYPAEINQVQLGDDTWHRVTVTGFAALTDARAFVATIDGRHGVSDAWLSRTR